jgi:transaldolase/glucose-6-phosphate isomerase
MSKIHELSQMGQAIWIDFIRRSFITSGELQKWVDLGVRGITSNPTIFEKAIAGSSDYDRALRLLARAGKAVSEIYEALAMEDIRMAADILRPVYDQTDGRDGYVSLEVNPALSHDTAGTIQEARRLFAALGRPNVMIKIPATAEGIPAIEASISQGINVNVTLIFSLAHYSAAALAYIAGLEKLAASGGDVSRLASVASFFVSRVDTAVDRQLQEIGEAALQGKIAVANSRMAYACFKEIFQGERWERLEALGARVQRPLWASTGTKNPAYSDTLYVDTLIGPDTVNTLPPATLEAWSDHGEAALTVEAGLDQARDQVARLTELGIDLASVTQTLQDEGVASFAQSFEALMASIALKRQKILEALRDSRRRYSAELGDFSPAVTGALERLDRQDVIQRIWDRDHRLWGSDPHEISNRLGWLRSAETMQAETPRLQALVREVVEAGYSHALLLGMGGSSLAPEVFRVVFGVQPGLPDLSVLDSTDPGAVLALAERLDPAKTLYVVSTKSGGTVETSSFFKYFYNQAARAVGEEKAGEHFIAINDPGSSLADLATRYRFRATLLNDPDIGGRYSALSHFGLYPAALTGVDLPLLLERAIAMADDCAVVSPAEWDNPGASLGAMIGALALEGRDKLTFILSPSICAFGDWIEQLVAESTGKQGRGILPVVGETIGAPDVYGEDRLFVYLRLEGEGVHDAAVRSLEDAGQPVIRLELKDVYDLGGQFFLWMMATAVAGHILGVNPFDQPDVESAKAQARGMLTAYQKEGRLPELRPSLRAEGISVFSDLPAHTPGEALKGFLAQAGPGAYVALQAYIQPTDETDAALLALKTRLRDATRLAVTSGYGPRFLHSTGQLHKGDAGKGLFIQLTGDNPQDAPIPDQAGSEAATVSFGVLKMAQALGDRQALLDAGRKVIRFHLGKETLIGLTRLANSL